MVCKTSKTSFQPPNSPDGPVVAVKRPSLKLMFVTTVLVSTLLLCFVYVNTVQDSPSDAIRRGKLLPTFHKILSSFQNVVQWYPLVNKTPRILLWNPFFSKEDYLSRPRDIGCPVDCTVSSNRSLLNESDAILLHFRNTDLADLPKWRNNKQRWVLYNLEAPPHTSIQTLIGLDNKINWTATYRNDSDIIVPYGKVVARRKSNHSKIPEFQEKTNLICWIVSNCNTPSSRETYVTELRKYVEVATYGNCGNLSCPADRAIDCYKEISKSCKFYLSFENSLCRDYMTEKVFNVLRTDMVPIVMGGPNYSSFLPSHSYIDALEYEDPSELASFLRKLDKNVSEYMKYHAWKSDYDVDQSTLTFWSCDLCKMLHDPSLQWSKHEDLVKWWYDDATCFSWVQYFHLLNW